MRRRDSAGLSSGAYAGNRSGARPPRALLAKCRQMALDGAISFSGLCYSRSRRLEVW